MNSFLTPRASTSAFVLLGALAAVGLVGTLSACGQPHVDTPSTVAPKAPALAVAPNAQSGKVASLNLTGAANDVSVYAGSLVIWDDAIAPQQLTTLLDATKRYNSVAAQAQVALAAYETPRLAALAAQTDAINALLQQDAASVNVRQQERANTWIAAEIDRAVAADATLDEGAKASLKTHANTSFAKYCESQVFVYAFNPILAKGVFTQRPSPNALCEPVYATLGFFQGDSCAPAESGKSYYSCIWTEGVARTSFYARFGTATRAILAKAMSSEAGRARVALGSSGPTVGCGFAALEKNINIMNSLVSCPDIFKDFSSAPIDVRMKNADDTVVVAKNVDLDSATPTIITETWHAFESRLGPCNTGAGVTLCPWPNTILNGNNLVPTSQSVKKSLQTTGEKMSAFVTAIGGCDKELSKPNDAFFNAYKLKDITSLEPCEKPTEVSQYPDVFALPSPAIAAAQEKKDALVAQLYAGKNNFCKPPTTSRFTCASPAFANNWECKILKYTNEKFLAVEAKGVAQVVYRDFRLTVRRNANGTRALLMGLGAGDVAGACIAPAGGTAPRSCGLDRAITGEGLAASYNDKTGQLLLTMPVRAKLFGANFNDTASKRYVEALKKLEGQQLVIEAYPSLMEGTLQYLSGKATVRRGAVETAQGVASYLFDNRFETAQGRFCQAKY